MPTAIGDLLRWYEREGHNVQYAQMAEQLMPQDPEIVDPHPENSLMQIVCQRTGLAPSEWEALSSLKRLPWLRDALDSAGAEPKKGQATKSENGKPRRKYMKHADAERISKEKFSRLWRDSTKSEWSRQIGCERGQVEKLPAWHRAEKRRKGWRQIATRLKNVVDPTIIQALYMSDASALGKLSAEDHDKFDSLPDQERVEMLELLTDQARDAVS